SSGAIIRSLREHARHDEERGMYWKMAPGWTWQEAGVDMHALMAEVFHEVARDSSAVADIQSWLLAHKHTNRWETTRETVNACHALLLRGTQDLSPAVPPVFTVGDTTFRPADAPDINTQSGTGYFKKSWHGGEVSSDMGNITVDNSEGRNSQGAVYWQYFEDLDKIKGHDSPLSLRRELFIEEITPAGRVLKTVRDTTSLQPGDRLIVRLHIQTDRAMEFLHLKDMRAAALEPENVLSGYTRKNGLGYYESTGDGSTDFFIDYLPTGDHLLEYPLRVTHRGSFSNGIARLQCMYAPAFSAHSKGHRLKVE
ncbi:MAG: alpha-2-macroglobulin family protein, partial [Fibrobacterota bacterium]